MASEPINALHSSVVDKVDPYFKEAYNQAQAPRLRADQVPYEVFNKSRGDYGVDPSVPLRRTPPEVASKALYKVPVTSPPGEISVQVYIPTSESLARNNRGSSPLPALVNYHGGGFVIGNLSDDVHLCQQICDGVGCAVVNVEYRTSPEFPHPTPALDSWDALKWVFAHAASDLNIDPTRIAVSGLSAGACLAAVVALMARDADKSIIPHPLVLQILIVPVTDARYMPLEVGAPVSKDCPYESYTTLEHAPCLPLQRLVWFYNLWLGTEEPARSQAAADWRASPIAASSHAGLAPASFHCGGVDPLVDEGRAYHEKLVAAGVNSDFKVYEGQGHPWGQWDAMVPAAREYQDNCKKALQEAFQK